MTINQPSPFYRKAFENYLRKGTPMDVSVIVDPTPFYRWRTQQDDKVRPSHAANKGMACAWDAPPSLTGNPGNDFGCRCWAEPIDDATTITTAEWAAIAAAAVVLLTPEGRAVGRFAMGALRLRQMLRPNELPTEKLPDPAPSRFEKPEGVPDDWVEKPADKREGIKYVDPENTGNDVRMQKGKPDSAYPSQRKDYVVWKREGQYLDKDGNPVSLKSAEAHIPLSEFKFKPELYR